MHHSFEPYLGMVHRIIRKILQVDAMENQYYPFYNTPLPYEYNALEPFIDEKTMHLHHDRHLQTYIDNLNKIMEENPRLQRFSLEELLYNLAGFPQEISTGIRQNAGGVYNHRMYFETMSPDGNTIPRGRIKQGIDNAFGSYETFKKTFKESALKVFGSGYAMLVTDGVRYYIITAQNQNTPLELGLYPVIAIDVWEHAYYLKHYNVRAAYIDDWFQVVDWKKAEERCCSWLQ